MCSLADEERDRRAPQVANAQIVRQRCCGDHRSPRSSVEDRVAQRCIILSREEQPVGSGYGVIDEMIVEHVAQETWEHDRSTAVVLRRPEYTVARNVCERLWDLETSPHHIDPPADATQRPRPI